MVQQVLDSKPENGEQLLSKQVDQTVSSTSDNTSSEKDGGLWAGVTKYHILVFLGCWLGGIFDGLDSTLFTVMLPNAVKELQHTTDRMVISQVNSYVTSVFLIGWMLGGVIFGVVGDKLGRVKAMVFSILLYAIFTGAAGLAQDPVQLGICRFLTGLGIGGELVSIATLLSETWPERSRAIAVGSLISSYQIGFLLSGILTSFIQDWRTAFMIGALPALLAIFIQTKLHEPEKWQNEQANNQHAPAQESPLAAIFAPAHRKNVIVGGVAFGALLIGYWASLAWIPTWLFDFFTDEHKANEAKSIATMFHGFAAVAGCLLSGYFANAIGRRSTIMLTCVGAFIASALLFMTNDSFNELIYWQDAMLGFFIGMMQAVMYIYLPELFPTRVRATAVGFCLNVGRFSAAVAALYVKDLVQVFGGYSEALMAFSVPYLIALVAAWIGHETRNQALPD